MKQIIVLFAALVFHFTASAKIWRVNNNVGVNADFTTLQAAHNGASAGDTLYLESSPTSYGGLNATKKLIIIGTGYFLDQNLNLQATAMPSRADAITLNVGAAGSVIAGLTFNGSAINIYADNVIVQRNYFGTFSGSNFDWTTGTINIYSSASNIYITQNFAVIIYNNSVSTGLLITGNYISYGLAYGEGTSSFCLQLHTSSVAIIQNNIFRRGTLDVNNSNISNNIMYNGFFSGTGNLLSNNIANNSQFGTASGNQENVNMSSVFELTGTYDARWKLKAGSPALGAGYGSTPQNPVDCGMFGGSTPYVLSGIPAIPSIYYFANQPVGSNSDPIDVQIKVKSNN
jgi:hypothetical protein